jgi:hypothetical protein
MLDHLKKWWAVYGAVIIAGITSAYPSFAANHPYIAGYIASGVTFVAGITKSPTQ